MLIRRYEDQVFRLRHQRQPKLDTALGCRVGAVPPKGIDDAFRLAFNAACVPLTWRSVEPTESGYRWAEADAAVNWAVSRNLRVFAGPLIDFSDHGLPDYVLKLRGEPLSFKSLMCDYVETVVKPVSGQGSRWLITAGANGSDALGIREEDLIRLTAMAADAAWQIDSGLQLVFGLSQPWGDYLGGAGFEYSPFVYADTLLRSGTAVRRGRGGVATSARPRGGATAGTCSGRRSSWTCSASSGYRSRCRWRTRRRPGRTRRPTRSELPAGGGRWRDFTPAAQADWAAAFASLALCKSYVARRVLGPPDRRRPAPHPERRAGGRPGAAQAGVRPAAGPAGGPPQVAAAVRPRPPTDRSSVAVQDSTGSSPGNSVGSS